MSDKMYQIPGNEDPIVRESAVVYSKDTARHISKESMHSVSKDEWNPNVPFHGTQEEWWEHFHRIEEGNFMTLEEFDHKFETWKKKYLASKLK